MAGWLFNAIAAVVRPSMASAIVNEQDRREAESLKSEGQRQLEAKADQTRGKLVAAICTLGVFCAVSLYFLEFYGSKVGLDVSSTAGLYGCALFMALTEFDLWVAWCYRLLNPGRCAVKSFTLYLFLLAFVGDDLEHHKQSWISAILTTVVAVILFRYAFGLF